MTFARCSLALLLTACSTTPSSPVDAATLADAPVADDASISPDAIVLGDAGSDAATTVPRLAASGSSIVDPSGAPIQLRGYSWGAWGTAEADDGPANHDAGANVVRLPLRWWGDYRAGIDSYDPTATDFVDPQHLSDLRDTIEWATGAGLWVVLFLDSNCGQGASSNAAWCGDQNFWNDPEMLARFTHVWQVLVETYRDHPLIAAYELLPEPQYTGANANAAVRAFYDTLIPSIRALDARTPIIVGPNGAYNSNYLEDAYTTSDDNLIYTVDYFLFSSPMLGHLTDMQAFQAAHHVPVWVNQIGVESGRPMADVNARAALQALNDANIGWAWWTYRIDSTNADVHGIYYRGDDGVTWIEKPDWLALVTSYF